MRIRGYSEESEDGLEEVDEELKNISGDIADLTKINGKGGISIFTDASKSEYKSTYQILKEISEIWHDLTDAQQAQLLEKLAGKRGGQVLAGILNDFSSVDEALKTMEDAAGSANREMGIIEQSLDYKINTLKETWVGFLQEIIKRDSFGEWIDRFTSISNGVTNLISKLGLLRSTLSAIVGMAVASKLKNNIMGGAPLTNLALKQGQTTEFLQKLEADGLKDANGENVDIKAFASQMHNVSDSAIIYAESVQKGNIALKDGTSLLKGYTTQFSIMGKLGNKFVGVLKSIPTMLGSALLSAGVTWLASTGISMFLKSIDKALHKSKYIQKAAQNAKSKIENLNSELKDSVSTIENVRDRYAELAQEVDHLGTINQSQGTLSNDEYKEFLDISNQLAEKFPQLTKGYDENGDAILDLSGDVDTIVGSLNNLVDTEKELASQKIRPELPDVWKGYEDDLDKYENKIDKVNKKIGYLNSFDQENGVIANDYYEDRTKVLQEVAERAGLEKYLDYNTTSKQSAGTGDSVTYLSLNIDDLNSNEKEALHNAIISLEHGYENELNGYKAFIVSENKEASDYIIQQFETEDLYKKLPEELQKVFISYLSNYDYSDLYKEGFTKTYSTIFEDFNKMYGGAFGESGELDTEKAEKLIDLYNKIYNVEADDSTSSLDKINLLNHYLEELSVLLGGIDIQKLKEILGVGTTEDNVEKVKKKLGYTKDAPSLFGKSLPSLLTEEEKARNELIDSVASDLTDEQIELVIDKIDMDEVAKLNTKDELIDYINSLQEDADKNPIEVTLNSAAVKSLNDLESDWSGLDTVYSSTVTTAGTAEAKDIESVNSAMGGVSKAGDEEINSLSNAIEAYDTALVESKGDTVEAQKAVDKLTTAYIDQSGVLDDLDESKAQYYIDMLEANGITNAEEVVMSRLSDTAKRTAKNIKELSKVLVNNYNVLKNSSKGSKDYNKSMSEIKDATTNLLSYEQDGEIIMPTLSDEFILQNLEDIKAATEGDIEALNRLRIEAAKEIVTDIKINAPSQEIMGIQNEINQLIDSFDIENIEIGTNLDDTAMIQGLNNLVKAGYITRDDMNSALASIGVVPEETGYVDIPISTFGSISNAVAASGLKGIAATEAAKGYSKLDSTAKIRVPSFGYKLANKATGSRYGGAKSSSSGGGGGGGGGGSSSEPTKPKDESEEMFDWVEVAIQRLQEAEQRLDKAVGNTYSLWTDRNKALGDEINNVTDQINAQRIAMQEYYNYANSVQVNGGKGLNPDDYGENDELVRQHDQALLDEAIQKWATGEYQRKIQQGQLSGDDIEKISNHFLTDAIKEYQEYYNKGVAAGDAVQDLTIKLGELAETKFNNIKSEFDELIAYVTSYADIIDERINRTEEHGYFVSKDYYKQLIAYENQELAYLTNKRADLIKARDEAVAAGYIQQGSSAWNEMNQEILATEKGIEECNTQIVTFNNNIRDLDWEIFDWLEERISRITDEAQFLVDLMSNDQLYEDDGRLTNLGQATNGLYAIQYETLMRQAQDYAAERIKLEREIAKDPANKDLIERYEELVDAQQDVINSAEDMKNAVKDLVEEGINRHLSALDEIIDKYNEMMDKEKEAYEYSKNIEKQVENINNLEKMLNAYAGDDSEETRKIRQQTANQLEEARQQLEETEWDKMISETKELLTDMRDEYEEVLMARLDNVDALMADMIERADANAETIKETVETEAAKVGYDLTTPLKNIVDNSSSASTLVSSFMEKFDKSSTSVQAALDAIKAYVYSMTDAGKAEIEAQRQAEIQRQQQEQYAAQQAEIQRQTEEAQRQAQQQVQQQATSAPSSPQGDGTPNVGDAVTFDNGRYYADSYGNGKSGSKYQGQQVYITKINPSGSKPYHISTGSTLHSGDLGWVTLDQLRGYAVGSRRIPHNQLAWTQEKGSEIIYRSSDGAMLTPLGSGDMVFTNEMSQRLFDLAKMGIPRSNSSTAVPSVSSKFGNNVTNQNAISFTLPNVKNYDEFVNAMKRDSKFAGFIQEITFGQANGNNSLKKYNY